ncbi:MAG: M20/M25/M40 family metallo-hydrolase [Bacteroidetes bacterium]|nr:M20/M25/M40 family metallo-hydrolase [Bacteroidota bacterium]
MNRIIFLITLVFSVLSGFSQNNIQITASELRDHVGYLASDDLAGRKPGTMGDSLSRAYIAEQFHEAGLMPVNGSYFQEFEVVADVILGEDNSLEIQGKSLKVGEDYTPFAFSSGNKLEARVVFAGYGFDFQNDSVSWNDFEGIDVSGKWVMMIRGEPDPNNPYGYGRDRDKVITAKDHGAAGVILVSGKQWDDKDKLVSIYYDRAGASAGIPVIQLKRDMADSLLQSGKRTIEDIENQIISTKQPLSFEIPYHLKAETDILQVKVKTANVMGMVEGSDPVLKNEYIVIGAHYDHLGMGGPGSGSRVPDTSAVHNGADDNASGVAGVIEIAEELQINRASLKRSVIAVAFSAEEMGLLGSKYFVQHSPVDKTTIKAMINFDMIGRLDPEKKSVMVGGTGTSAEAEEILNKLQNRYGLALSYSPEGYGPSDHAAFYAENIPVFFINTGVHSDYHTPQDDVEFINFEGQEMVSKMAYDLIMAIDNRQEDLTFRESGPKERTNNYMNLKVTLGIMPDFTSSANDGLGVGGVKKDGPAEKCGLLKGDIITAIDGNPVGNIYDYMNRLKKLEPGQIITVDVMRNGEKKVLIVQL